MARTFTISSTAQAQRLNLERDLNEAQRAAVACGDGPKLVIAGAGSGKTRTITYRVAWLIAKGILPSQILLATFTNKAAREMFSRVEALTGGDGLGRRPSALPSATPPDGVGPASVAGSLWGGTFHAIGNRLLRHHAAQAGLEPNYSIVDEADQRDLLKLCVTEAKVRVDDKRFPAPALIADLLSMAFNTQRPLAVVVEERAPHFLQWIGELERISARYDAKKRSANVVDYDDLLRFWLRLLDGHPAIAERLGRQFRRLLVDEYQDTNIIQARIIERLAEHNGRNLMVVGDDSQSIYGWRGANYDNILKFPERNPGTEIFKLELNYRSTPEILEFTNASIHHNHRQHRKTLVAQRPRGSLPVVLPLNDVYQEAAFVAERVLQLRDDGIPLEEIAVLYRAHAHSSILQAELIKRNIPYEVRSGVRFFEQAHIKDVVAHLKVLDNPFDEMAWRRLWLMLPRIGHATAARLWEAISPAAAPLQAVLAESIRGSLPSAAQVSFKRFQHDLRALASMAEDASPSALIQAVMETAYLDYLRATYDDVPSRLEDLQQLTVFARAYRTRRSFLSELVLLGELYGQGVTGNGSADSERLILSSVHQAKGLEWRVVFLIRMCEGAFPSEIALREPEGEEEERRIFYVATTRAKDELYIAYPLMEMSGRANASLLLQPSRFLREIRFSLYEYGQLETQDGANSWEADRSSD